MRIKPMKISWKKHRKATTGKRVVSAHHTTQEIHAQFKECENATFARKDSEAHGRRKSAPVVLETIQGCSSVKET
jgi:hypothetical protein